MGKRDWGQSEHKPGVEVVVEPVEGAPVLVAKAQGVVSKDRWPICEECGKEIWHEMNKEYYHTLKCSKSNGIGYYEGERLGVPGNKMQSVAQK
jgi:hypothetical protein